MSDYAILLGGNVIPTPRLIGQIQDRHIIAADSGIRHAKALNVEVSKWVGDFDSATPEMMEEFSEIPRERFPTDKGQTDGEIALGRALEAGAQSLLIIGAFGGTTSHATNNILMALDLSIPVIFTSGTEEAVLLNAPVAPDWPVGIRFSILAFDDLTSLDVSGAKWPLKNQTIRAGAGHTLSNVVTGDLSISVKTGRALAIAEFHETAK